MKPLFAMLILLALKMNVEAVETGATAPQWDVPSAVRGTFDSSFYAGKVLVLNFWDTRCGACRIEMPALAAIYNDLHPRGLEIVGIAVHETTTSVAAFLREVPVPYGIGLSTDQILGDFNIEFVPTTIVIDQANKIAAVHLGFTDDSVVREEVLALLNTSNVGPSIALQPVSQTVRLGAPFAFSVSVSGSGPFQFQWFHQGQFVTGATNSVFAANAASMNDSGSYSVSVSNSFGSVVSDSVTLIVDPSIEAPNSVTINLTNQSEILLNWGENEGPVSGFRIERRTVGNFSVIASLPGDSRQFRDSIQRGSASINVTYRIQAFNSVTNSPYSSEAQVQIPAGVKPLVLSRITLQGNQIILSVGGDSGQNFLIEMSEDLGIWTTISTNNLQGSSQDIPMSITLTGNAKRFFRARSF